MWADVETNELASFNTRYRTSIACHAWVLSLVDLGKIKKLIAAGTKHAGGRVHIDRVEWFEPKRVPDEWIKRGIKPTDWGLRITWRKVAEGTPVHVLAAAIIAVLIVATAAWVIVTKFTEKETEQLLEKGGDTLRNTLLNPGLVIAALVAIVVLKRR